MFPAIPVSISYCFTFLGSLCHFLPFSSSLLSFHPLNACCLSVPLLRIKALSCHVYCSSFSLTPCFLSSLPSLHFFFLRQVDLCSKTADGHNLHEPTNSLFSILSFSVSLLTQFPVPFSLQSATVTLILALFYFLPCPTYFSFFYVGLIFTFSECLDHLPG